MQLSDDVHTFFEEPRFAVLATGTANGSPQRVTLLLHVDRADVHGFDGEE